MKDIEGDRVTNEWVSLHGIRIPRAKGIFESPSAWVKTDESGTIIAAGVKDQSALAYMIQEQILQEHHGYYGMVFQDLRRYFLKRLSHTSNPIYASEFFGSDLSDGEFETMYVKLTRELGNRLTRAITFACTASATSGVAAKLYSHRKDYLDAFERLVKVTDYVRKEYGRAE